MWTRAELKNRAKQALKGTFLVSVLVVVLYLILTGNENTNITFRLGENAGRDLAENTGFSLDWENWDSLERIIAYPLAAFYMLFGAMAGIVSLLYSIFVAGPLEMGLSKYFLSGSRKTEANTPINLFHPFRSGWYLNNVGVFFMRNLFIFLFALLLIIPGIIKALAYSMVPYIMADNPTLGYREALDLSSRMTDGHKMDIFILEHSFIGWYLLTILTLGLAAPLVTTYRFATLTELYEHLRYVEEDRGLSSEYF